jgi:hypothetical protein
MYLLEARLNGIELSGIDRRKFMEFLRKLIDAKNHYRFLERYSFVLFVGIKQFAQKQVVDCQLNIMRDSRCKLV